MISIIDALHNILNAVYGEEVRTSIHDAIYQMDANANEAIDVASGARDSAQAYAQAAEQSKEDAQSAAGDAANAAANAAADVGTLLDSKISEASGYATNAADSATEAAQEASNATSEANRAKAEADRAAQVVGVGVATTTTAGIVKPDGDTITIDSDGTIHGSSSVIVDNVTIKESTEQGHEGELYVNIDNDTLVVEDGKIKARAGHIYDIQPVILDNTTDPENPTAMVQLSAEIDPARTYEVDFCTNSEGLEYVNAVKSVNNGIFTVTLTFDYTEAFNANTDILTESVNTEVLTAVMDLMEVGNVS